MPTDDRSTRLHFSLRTLLIVITLIVAVLGAIVLGGFESGLFRGNGEFLVENCGFRHPVSFDGRAEDRSRPANRLAWRCVVHAASEGACQACSLRRIDAAAGPPPCALSRRKRRAVVRSTASC